MTDLERDEDDEALSLEDMLKLMAPREVLFTEMLRDEREAAKHFAFSHAGEWMWPALK